MKVFLLIIFIVLNIMSLALAQESYQAVASGVSSDFKVAPTILTEKSSEIVKHCTGCHSLQRIDTSVNEWMKLSKPAYKEMVTTMITKKMRLMNGELTRQSSQKIRVFLLDIYAQLHT